MTPKHFLLIYLIFFAVIPVYAEKTDMDESIPPMVTPGQYGNPDQVGKPPSDAIILFDGSNFDHWESTKGEPVKWKLIDRAMEVVRGTGTIQTKEKLGYGQYHVEWKTPKEV